MDKKKRSFGFTSVEVTDEISLRNSSRVHYKRPKIGPQLKKKKILNGGLDEQVPARDFVGFGIGNTATVFDRPKGFLFFLLEQTATF